MRTRYMKLISLFAVLAMVLAACGGDDDSADTTAAADTATTADAAGDTYEVFALLPQGNDQPYGSTYLPPM